MPKHRREHRHRPPGRRRARRRCGSRCCTARPAAGPGSKAPSTSRPQTFSNGTRPTRLLDVDAAVAERGTLLVGLGDLGRERDDTLQALMHLRLLSRSWRLLRVGLPLSSRFCSWRSAGATPGSHRGHQGGRWVGFDVRDQDPYARRLRSGVRPSGDWPRTTWRPDPFTTFQRWYHDARRRLGVRAERHGGRLRIGRRGARPSRLVLLKGFSPAGWVFFTNLGSRKGI